MKPLAVVISGAPGAGKTTLGSELERHMRLPHISRDKIGHGLERTSGETVDRANHAIPLYYRIVSNMLDNGISLITDGTIYEGISENELQEYVLSHAFAVNVHVRASNEWERFRQRELNRQGWSSNWLKGHEEIFNNRYPLSVNPLDLGVPVIEVDASDGYVPSIAELSNKIIDLYNSSKKEFV